MIESKQTLFLDYYQDFNLETIRKYIKVGQSINFSIDAQYDLNVFLLQKDDQFVAKDSVHFIVYKNEQFTNNTAQHLDSIDLGYINEFVKKVISADIDSLKETLKKLGE